MLNMNSGERAKNLPLRRRLLCFQNGEAEITSFAALTQKHELVNGNKIPRKHAAKINAVRQKNGVAVGCCIDGGLDVGVVPGTVRCYIIDRRKYRRE